jgi:hypothetical protein
MSEEFSIAANAAIGKPTQSIIPGAALCSIRVLIPVNAPVPCVSLGLAFEEFVAYRIPDR